MERRLTAILAADVVGNSRLMGEDEVGTLARLKDEALLAAQITPQPSSSTDKIRGPTLSGLALFSGTSDLRIPGGYAIYRHPTVSVNQS